MRKKGYLLLILVVIAAFWQIFFLQNGMKWDFVDAFLPSRYFFTESILNNQFPLWNPYLLYGVPIFADLVSVFNPEFWIVGNLFGYSNITLQFVFLAYIFLAGVSFNYFLKQFKVDQKLSLALSVSYMLSGLTIGNAQHIAFVYGYALVPFVLASYFLFVRELNRQNFVRVSVSLFLVIFGGYPGITIILGYFLICIFIYSLVVNRSDKSYLKKLLIYHLILIVTVVLFSSVLIVAYFQGAPFLARYGGLPVEIALKHPFTLRSFISFILPMAAGTNAEYFGTDQSMTNAYFGIIGLILFLFSLTKRVKEKESYLILGFGIVALLVSLGKQLFLREFFYNYFPLMNLFQYPAIFRGFAIFSFLAFAGINLKSFSFDRIERKRLASITAFIAALIVIFVLQAFKKVGHFAFFQAGKSFSEELSVATRFDDIILQGFVQLIFLVVFVLLLWKINDLKKFSLAILSLFVFDGIISTQLSTHYTVISNTNPVKFYEYLKASPKGFPIPELNPIGENSDRNASNDFVWMNDNVFPKKVTFDGLVSFKLDGYDYLADNHPELLEAIKKEPVIYFSDDVRKNSEITNFSSKTVFLSAEDFSKVSKENFKSEQNDKLVITKFSPTKIEIKTATQFPELLVYQQNYFTSWKVFIDGKQEDLLKSNFAHIAVLVPSGEHTVTFEFRNMLIKVIFCFSYLIFTGLLILLIYYAVTRHPERKKRIFVLLISGGLIFIFGTLVNRYLYQKNKWGDSSEIIEETKKWRKNYKDNVAILLSTNEPKLKSLVPADTSFYVNEKTNIASLSHFLMNAKSEYFAFAWQGGILDDNVKELLYSFYPKIVEESTGNNSGLILLKKDKAGFDYAYFQDFEGERTENWLQDKTKIKTDSVTGNHSYFFDSGIEWGASIDISVDEKLQHLEKMVIVCDVLMEKNPDEALLVFTSERSGEINLYQVTNIARFVNKPDEWGRVVFVVNLKSKLKEGDKLKIYFWNQNKIPFQVDNLGVKYFFSDSE